MECPHEQSITTLEKTPMLFCHFEIAAYDASGSNPAQANNDLRPDQGYLAPEIPDALFHFFRHRVTILGRTAFHYIGNINIPISIQIHHLQHFIQ